MIIVTKALYSCVQFMVLLILRHTLPLIISGNKDYSFPLIMVKLICLVYSILEDSIMRNI